MKNLKKILTSFTLAIVGIASFSGLALKENSSIAKAEDVAYEGTETFYLDLTSFNDWNTADEKFALYFYNSTTNIWTDFMTTTDTTYVYSATVPTGTWSAVIAIRFNSTATEPGWSNYYNQTVDLTLSSGYNCVKVTGWGEYTTSSCPASLTAYPALTYTGSETFYLDISGCTGWSGDSAQFALYFHYGDTSAWTGFMSAVAANVYSTTVPGGTWSYVNAVRLKSSATEASWDYKDNQTPDLALSSDYNCVQVTGWGTNYGDDCPANLSSYEYVETTYTLGVGDSSYEMILHESNTDEYTLASTVSVSAGDSVVVYKDNVSVSATADPYGKNNAQEDTSGNVTVMANADDVNFYYSVSANTIYIGGIPSDAASYNLYVGGVFTSLVDNSDSISSSDGQTGEYTISSYTFNNGDVIQFVDNSSSSSLPVLFTPTLDTYSIAGFEVTSAGALTYTGTESLSVAIYLKIYSSTYGGSSTVYFGNVPEAEAEAIAYAQSFNSALGAVCQADGSTDASALSTAWSTQATAYAALSADAKNYLNGTTSSTSTDISDFQAKYNYIYGKYGSSLSLDDFNGTGSTTVQSLSSSNSSINSYAAIALIAVVTLLAAGGAIYLVHRRRNNSVTK